MLDAGFVVIISVGISDGGDAGDELGILGSSVGNTDTPGIGVCDTGPLESGASEKGVFDGAAVDGLRDPANMGTLAGE